MKGGSSPDFIYKGSDGVYYTGTDNDDLKVISDVVTINGNIQYNGNTYVEVNNIDSYREKINNINITQVYEIQNSD